jgi:hypothetical protein
LRQGNKAAANLGRPAIADNENAEFGATHRWRGTVRRG